MTDNVVELPKPNFEMRIVEGEDFEVPHVVNTTMAENLLRKEFLQGVDDIVDYWERQKGSDTKAKMTGALFSVFSMLDGDGDFPACDIVSRDIGFTRVSKQTTIIPAGTHLCDGELHSQFVNRSKLLEEVASYQIDCDDN